MSAPGKKSPGIAHNTPRLRESLRNIKWFYPGMGVKRWFSLITLGVMLFSFGLAMSAGLNLYNRVYEAIRAHFPQGVVGITAMVVGLAIIFFGIRRLSLALLAPFLPTDERTRLVDFIYRHQVLRRQLKVVVVGGGTGLHSLLRGLKHYTTNLTAIVSVFDDGGSSGRLRKDFGMLPPGDIRNCLAALADDEDLMTALLQYRFEEGGELAGHNLGNLMLAALTEKTGNFEEAVLELSRSLAILGRVIPATLQDIELSAQFDDGSIAAGESTIPTLRKKIESIFLTPSGPTATPAAVEAILDADVIVMGPGSLYTSVIPNLLVPGIREAIGRAPGLKIFVGNIMTQPGETDAFSAADHLETLITYLQFKPDLYLCNDAIPKRLEKRYREEGQFPVRPDHDRIKQLGVRTLYADLMLEHDRVRHDPARVAAAVYVEALRHKERQEEPSDLEKVRRFLGMLTLESFMQEMWDEDKSAASPSGPLQRR